MLIVGLGGTTRTGSSTEKALRFALGACETRGAKTECFAAAELCPLTHFAPENPDRQPEAAALIDALRRADGVIIASSSYHGTISGLVKTALDYTEDMSRDERPYLSGRPVAVIATGGGWQGTVATLDHLRTVVHSLRGWVTPLGAAINTAQPAFDDEGRPVDDKVRGALEIMADELLSFRTA